MTRTRALVAALALAATATLTAAPQLASRTAEEWIKTLDNPARLANLRIDDIIGRLGLKPGDTVADIGAGSGTWEGPLAAAVPSGRVYAVDIDQGLLDAINARAAKLGVRNVTTVLGAFTDPKLPVRTVNLAFIHDVLHHIEDRNAYVKNLAGYLAPGGRVAVVEFEPATSPHRDQPAMVISRQDGDALMAAAGLTPVEVVEMFDDKWFVIYGKR
ncbi:MAG: class I SAM-dependent methyltransferase [Acidimicrobiia bacterium]|nr:class I SAM-dependent methyltransferase [Acidimicrobiia bacterium]